ncbi:MAG: hypothetical protein HC806_08075 [Anaerolineae bacterium]|nr:hypothetical protein [Anaerolineae bacterium]
MQEQKTGSPQPASILRFILGCIGLISIPALDKLYWRIGVLTEGSPDFSQLYLFRSTIIFVSTLAVVWVLVGLKKPRPVIVKNDGIPVETTSILGTLSFSLIFLILFIFAPSTFSTLSLEDGLIEWASALLLFGGCILFAINFLKYRKNTRISNAVRLSFVILSLVLFVTAMEEISWFQRVFEVESPTIFTRTDQKELNLHNFATNYVENIYYTGAYLFLVVFAVYIFAISRPVQ